MKTKKTHCSKYFELLVRVNYRMDLSDIEKYCLFCYRSNGDLIPLLHSPSSACVLCNKCGQEISYEALAKTQRGEFHIDDLRLRRTRLGDEIEIEGKYAK